MGNKVQRRQEDIQMIFVDKKPLKQAASWPKQAEIHPLNERSGNIVIEELKKMPLQSSEDSKLAKSKQKMGQFKVKKAKELRDAGKQNEKDGEELESLAVKIYLDCQLPPANSQIAENSKESNFFQAKNKEFLMVNHPMLATNKSETRSKKFRTSKML